MARKNQQSPIGTSHREGMRRRARRSREYREELERIEPFERIARFVILRRMQLGLTQAELAKRMGTSNTAVARIECGQPATSVRTLERLAKALETKLEIGFAHESEVQTADQREVVGAAT
jgi:ribosome-binding protein aMBF1 (putative translation factor)